MVWETKTINRNRSGVGTKDPVLQAPLTCKHGLLEGTCHFCLGGKPSLNGVGSGPPGWFMTERTLGMALTFGATTPNGVARLGRRGIMED